MYCFPAGVTKRASPFFVSSVTSSRMCCATSDTLKIQRGAVTPMTIHTHSSIIHGHDHVVLLYRSKWNSCKPAVEKKKKKIYGTELLFEARTHVIVPSFSTSCMVASARWECCASRAGISVKSSVSTKPGQRVFTRMP